MAKVKTTCEVENYDEPRKPNLRVHSHWNFRDMVTLEIIPVGQAENIKITVCANDLIKAVTNCTNT